MTNNLDKKQNIISMVSINKYRHLLVEMVNTFTLHLFTEATAQYVEN